MKVKSLKTKSMKIKTSNPVAFVKRAFLLMYQGAGCEFGMGMLQRGVLAQTEEDIFKNVCTQGDYAPYATERAQAKVANGEYYGDYVFGRMIKYGCVLKDGVLEFSDREFRPDYQGFANVYPKLKDLLDATAKSLDTSYEVVT